MATRRSRNLLPVCLGALLISSALCLSAPAWAVCGGASPSWTVAQPVAGEVHRSDVADCVTSTNAALQDGDTVNIPAGTSPSGDWTTTVTINNAINLIGAGQGVTVLKDEVSKGTTCSGAGASQPIINMLGSGNKNWRISGFTIQGVTVDTSVCTGPHLQVSGSAGSGAPAGNGFRIDHLTILQTATAIAALGDLRGVIDHNMFDATASPHRFGITVEHGSWQGVGGNGDNSWATPDSMGTSDAVFIEDNHFIDPRANAAGQIDPNAGARVVFRYNPQVPKLGSHGTETAGRKRSVRQMEIYNNCFDVGTQDVTSNGGNFDTLLGWRGGTGVVYNNTF